MIASFVIFLFSKEIFESFSAERKMDWENATRYCFEKGGRLPSVDKIELSYNYSKKGARGIFKPIVYWTRDDIDIQKAMSFDYKSGLSYLDFKLRELNVICVK